MKQARSQDGGGIGGKNLPCSGVARIFEAGGWVRSMERGIFGVCHLKRVPHPSKILATALSWRLERCYRELNITCRMRNIRRRPRRTLNQPCIIKRSILIHSTAPNCNQIISLNQFTFRPNQDSIAYLLNYSCYQSLIMRNQFSFPSLKPQTYKRQTLFCLPQEQTQAIERKSNRRELNKQ